MVGGTRDENALFLAPDDAVWNRTLSEDELKTRLAKVAAGNADAVLALYRQIHAAAPSSLGAFDSDAVPRHHLTIMTEDTPSWRPLTAEDVVRRIAAECAFVSANGEVGIRLRPAAAIVRLYGEQFRTRPRRRRRWPKSPPLL
jgi:hypothetical protein